jgi:hypothetical protein
MTNGASQIEQPLNRKTGRSVVAAIRRAEQPLAQAPTMANFVSPHDRQVAGLFLRFAPYALIFSALAFLYLRM